MIKDMIVNLSLGTARDTAADFALSAAGIFNAHIAGMAFEYEPFFPPIDMGSVPADMIEAQRVENEKAVTDTIARFEEAARRSALSIESRRLYTSVAGAPDAFARIARRFDLSVVPQPGPDSPGLDEMFVEAALFNSGRPVLIVPYIQRSSLKLDRVLVCWDGSHPAARATADALPFLSRAGTTEIITVKNAETDLKEIPGADIAQHLARHGIHVELEQIVASGVDVANVILSHAADTSADLIVMGGYGHSRWREFILGGVTRGLLTSMTVPTLMSH